MNPVPPLTTILMEFLPSGGAEQTNLLSRALAIPKYGFYSCRVRVSKRGGWNGAEGGI